MKKKSQMSVGFSAFLLITLIILIVCLIFLIQQPEAAGKIIQNNEDDNQQQIMYEDNKEPETCFTIAENCEEFLMNYLKEAKAPRCAFYEINLENITNHLLLNNIITVIEDSTYDQNFITYKTYGLMHNKFCADNASIISGSMNPTYNDAYRNNNNLIIIHSKYLSQNYDDEFQELESGINAKGAKVRYPIVILNNKTVIKNYFCPDDDCSEKVLNELKKANQSVYFMTFSFTDDSLGDYLISQKDVLDIKGIFEKQQLSNYSEYEKMNKSNMNVIIDKNKYKLHHKVFIIDNETIITGSYNPSSNADSNNDENILIITDKDIAAKYLKEFEKLYD